MNFTSNLCLMVIAFCLIVGLGNNGEYQTEEGVHTIEIISDVQNLRIKKQYTSEGAVTIKNGCIFFVESGTRKKIILVNEKVMIQPLHQMDLITL